LILQALDLPQIHRRGWHPRPIMALRAIPRLSELFAAGA
jgi:hypothetical protein